MRKQAKSQGFVAVYCVLPENLTQYVEYCVLYSVYCN